jgi:hypothetical protein
MMAAVVVMMAAVMAAVMVEMAAAMAVEMAAVTMAVEMIDIICWFSAFTGQNIFSVSV